MPRPTIPPPGFRFSSPIPVSKIVPNYDVDTATITFTAKGKTLNRTLSFTWDLLADFQARAEALVNSLQ